ncbi:AAA family ATPase [Bradyrhizobium mercantei]|uniref:AAA family ATPase n=1 Tax=Bradyrhizobium mercantei TaxID=1904807 RepID=UPI0009FA0554|nr:AAA family ATPase [Bradyrhizobium mercantei]
MSAADDIDDSELPPPSDRISSGAATDSSTWDERFKGLPRIQRYAMLFVEGAIHIPQRLMAETAELCPLLPENAAWATLPTPKSASALAARIDHLAVSQNNPDLRSLADCVRLVSLPLPCDAIYFDDYRRVGKALVIAFQMLAKQQHALRFDLERFTFGWAALPACTDLVPRNGSAAESAPYLGSRIAEHRIIEAAVRARRKAREEHERQDEARRQAEEVEQETKAPALLPSVATEVVPDHHLVVARLSENQMKSPKLKDILGPLKDAINDPLPLVEVRLLHEVRAALMFEFPYAIEVIDFALTDLVGRSTVHLRPLLIVGDAGGGKSRFARRLGETLGLNVWRTDASRSDGAVFGGTDRRWYSAEPCHSFLAVAQGKIANPLVLIDEIEKAGTRSDYGRFWDCLLGFLEPETNSRYPDPALQTNLNLSQVSYVATANALDPLPSPLRDRFRVVRFPKPTREHLDALLPAVMADLVRERGLDKNWVTPLNAIERAAVTQHWPGGSVRLLRRVVEALLVHRDNQASRH